MIDESASRLARLLRALVFGRFLPSSLSLKIKIRVPAPPLRALAALAMATTDKYDRQLRLWGAAGQRALGSTLVILVGSSACGTEACKNLVLPGVGSILVVDDDDRAVANGNENGGAAAPKPQASPELSDALLKFAAQSSNFFLPPQSKDGTLSNAAAACALLSELNPDVHGYHCSVPSLEDIDYSSFLKALLTSPPAAEGGAAPSKMLVVAADQPSSVNLPLSHACHALSIPLLAVRAYGLLGSVRIQTAAPYHAIIEAKPAHRIPDLRLSAHPLFGGLRRQHHHPRHHQHQWKHHRPSQRTQETLHARRRRPPRSLPEFDRSAFRQRLAPPVRGLCAKKLPRQTS